MQKILITLISIFSLIMSSSSSFALDPVAPKEERAFGFLRVDTPLPQSDHCEVRGVGLNNAGFVLPCLPDQQIKLPIGAYLLVVQLQGREWSMPISITPTEYTKVAVSGMGNLKVQGVSSADSVEVFSEDGRSMARFNASEIKTMPVGVYNVKVTTGGTMIMKNNVSIWPNTTRELLVKY